MSAADIAVSAADIERSVGVLAAAGSARRAAGTGSGRVVRGAFATGGAAGGGSAAEEGASDAAAVGLAGRDFLSPPGTGRVTPVSAGAGAPAAGRFSFGFFFWPGAGAGAAGKRIGSPDPLADGGDDGSAGFDGSRVR
jgi:hypothetical protein